MATACTNVELVDRLFVPQERWGWQYVEPAPLACTPDAEPMPVWCEPEAPDVAELQDRYQRAKQRWWPRLKLTFKLTLAVGVVNFLLSLIHASFVSPWLVFFGGLVWTFGSLVWTWCRITRIQDVAQTNRDIQYACFLERQQAWQTQIGQREESKQEQARREAALLWYPLQLRSGASRVDVFGGTGDGWASLLATLGSSLIQAGSSMLLVDFSGQYVGGGLASLAAARGIAVTQVDLPAELARVNLLEGLNPEELAEALAESVHTMRSSTDHTDLRALDAELVATVVMQLQGPVTFVRLVAGLRVLRRIYDISEDGSLSDQEVSLITSYVDTIGVHSERAQHELQFLTSIVDLLAQQERNLTPKEDNATGAGKEHTSLWWPRQGLTLVTTLSAHQRRKDFLDRVLFHRVLHQLHTPRARDGHDVLVVAGADHMGRDSLEALTRQARRVGVRLVLLLERLHGQMQQLLGSSDSAAILMKLGNAQEAAAAAEFIGRGHKFVLSQVTHQVGTTSTEGTGHTWGTSDTTSQSRTKGRSTTTGEHSTSWSRSTSKSLTQARSRSWQDSVNQSVADSTTDGTTASRVYEYTVEPTAIQSLPSTAFVLVESGSFGRRVIAGDCNPGIILMDRVSPDPLSS